MHFTPAEIQMRRAREAAALRRLRADLGDDVPLLAEALRRSAGGESLAQVLEEIGAVPSGWMAAA